MANIVYSDDRWLLPDDRLVGESEAFILNDLQYLTGIRGLSPEQLTELGIVKMQPKPDERYYSASVDTENRGQWVAIPVGNEDLIVSLKAYAAEKRWEKETGGVVVNGAPIKTDRESQGLIAGAFQMVTDDPAKIIKFKTAGGVFVSLDAATVTAIARAVGDHVQACFGLEEGVLAQIDSGEITTFEAVAEVFNPPGSTELDREP